MPKIICPAGVQILDYLTRRGYSIPAFCSGNGACGRCRVRVTEGSLPVTPSDRSFLSEAALAEGWRLSCCAVTDAPVTVELPAAPSDAEKPLHTLAADRAAAAQHRYALAVTPEQAALVDLTACTVTGIAADAPTLLQRYPDAEKGLCCVLTSGCTAAFPCDRMKIPPESAAALGGGDALEGLILYLFRN